LLLRRVALLHHYSGYSPPHRVRIGFKASGIGRLREGHERYRVGLKGVKVALKDDYKGV
jgi:hypothetical protein